ncbi:MAG: alpha/beta hydrolase [Alphaproteobacteria bacterium]
MPLDVSPVPQALRDAAYNNGAAVPSWSGTFARWTEEGLTHRRRHSETMDLAFGPKERQKIDLYPAQDPLAPCLVYFHGGYWQRNSRDMFAVLGEGVAAHGWSVAMPGYTLAPEASLAEIVEEVGMALDWLSTAGRRHGVAGPLIVSGWSAGGHLAALALAHPAVASGLALSGIFDLGPLKETYLDAALKLTAAEIADLSPFRRPAVMKPLAIAYGGNELPSLVGQSEGFYAQRRRAGAPGAKIVVEGADHFTVLNALRSPEGALTAALLDLV